MSSGLSFLHPRQKLTETFSKTHSRVSRLSNRYHDQNADFLNDLNESFGGLKTLKAFGAESVAVRRFRSTRMEFGLTARDLLGDQPGQIRDSVTDPVCRVVHRLAELFPHSFHCVIVGIESGQPGNRMGSPACASRVHFLQRAQGGADRFDLLEGRLLFLLGGLEQVDRLAQVADHVLEPGLDRLDMIDDGADGALLFGGYRDVAGRLPAVSRRTKKSSSLSAAISDGTASLAAGPS